MVFRRTPPRRAVLDPGRPFPDTIRSPPSGNLNLLCAGSAAPPGPNRSERRPPEVRPPNRGSARRCRGSSSELASQIDRAVSLEPAHRLAARRPLGQGGEGGKKDKVLDEENRASNQSGDGHRQPQVSLPKPIQAGAPERPGMAPRGDADELLIRVVHMKCLILQNIVKYGARLRIRLQDIAIDDKSSGRGFLGDMEEGEQRLRALRIHAKVVQAPLSRREPVELQPLFLGVALDLFQQAPAALRKKLLLMIRLPPRR